MRPLVRWMGSKARLASWYQEHMPAHRLYVETHGGSASVLLNKPRAPSEILNDRDRELFNLYTVVRDDKLSERFIDMMLCTPFSYDELAVAQDGAVSADPVERARKLIVRQAQAHGNDVRTDGSKKTFRLYVKDSGRDTAWDWVSYIHALADIINRLKGVNIDNRDAAALIRKVDAPDALFLVDPPYVMESRRQDRLGYELEYTDSDHRRLIDALLAAKGYVLLCGYQSALYDEALADWRQVTTTARDQMRGEREEVLWLSPRTAEALDAEKAAAVEAERAAAARQPDLFGAA